MSQSPPPMATSRRSFLDLLLGATSLAYSAAGTPVPEPGTAFLMGLGLFGLASSRRLTRR